jgi:hypothetical protein
MDIPPSRDMNEAFVDIVGGNRNVRAAMVGIVQKDLLTFLSLAAQEPLFLGSITDCDFPHSGG